MERNAAELTRSGRDAGRRTCASSSRARRTRRSRSSTRRSAWAWASTSRASSELRQVLDRGVDARRRHRHRRGQARPRCSSSASKAGATVAIDNRDELRLLLRDRIGKRATPARDRDASRPRPRAGRRADAVRHDAPVRSPTLRRAGSRTRFSSRGPLPSRRLRRGRASRGDRRVARRRRRASRTRPRAALPRHRRRHPDELPRVRTRSGTRSGPSTSARSQASASEITFDGHEIGTVYPYHQAPVRGDWLGRDPRRLARSRHGRRRDSHARARASLRAWALAPRRLRHDRGARRVQKAALRRHVAHRARDEPNADALDLGRLPGRSAPRSAQPRPASRPSRSRATSSAPTASSASSSELASLLLSAWRRRRRPGRLPEHRRLPHAHPRERLAPDPARAQPRRRRHATPASTRSTAEPQRGR